MVDEIYTVRIADAFGNIVRDKRVVWTDYASDLTVTVPYVMSSLWIIMGTLDSGDWDIVKCGGNRRFRKIWLKSFDGRYVLYVSCKRVKV